MRSDIKTIKKDTIRNAKIDNIIPIHISIWVIKKSNLEPDV